MKEQSKISIAISRLLVVEANTNRIEMKLLSCLMRKLNLIKGLVKFIRGYKFWKVR